jgi:cardiolipin synthase A/B
MPSALASSPNLPCSSPWRPGCGNGGVQVEEVLAVRLIRRPLARFDLRNHRKIAVMDGRVAYAGSFNVHDADFGLEPGRSWQEMMARLEGPVARQLQLLFLEDWSFATGELLSDGDYFPPVSPAREVLAQAVPGGPEHAEDPIHHLLVSAIHAASERIVITTPYFVPDEPMQMALRAAVLRGVRLDLVIPEKSDQRVADAAARGYMDELLRSGACVHLFTGGLLHTKSMSVDDRLAVLGSANFDRRSLFLNYEANVAIYDAGFAAQLRRRQEEYLRRATTLEPEWWARQPALHRRAYEMARLLSPAI